MPEKAGQPDGLGSNHMNQIDELGIDDDEGEWLDAGDESILVDYTKIQELIHTFKTQNHLQRDLMHLKTRVGVNEHLGRSAFDIESLNSQDKDKSFLLSL